MSFGTLRDALRARMDVVADHGLRDQNPQAHLEALKTSAERLNAEIAGLPADCDPMLRHFLERQSYLKAIAWLDENHLPSGQGDE